MESTIEECQLRIRSVTAEFLRGYTENWDIPPAIPPAMKDDAPEICLISSTRSSLASARFEASYELLSIWRYSEIIPKSDCTFRKYFDNIQPIAYSQRFCVV
jgi:hypothetical protein